jgi:hypothetical protein
MTKEAATKNFIATMQNVLKNDGALNVDRVFLKEDHAVVENLNCSITVPFQSDVTCWCSTEQLLDALIKVQNPTFIHSPASGLEIFNQTEMLLIPCEDCDDLSNVFLKTKGSYTDIGFITETTIKDLKTATAFVGNDDQKALLETVYLKDFAVATDKRKWFFKAVDHPLTDSIQLPVAVINLMAMYAGNWSVGKIDTKYFLNMVKLVNDAGIEICFNYDINSQYPDFKKALPKGELGKLRFNKQHVMHLIKKGMAVAPLLKKQGKISLNGVANFTIKDQSKKDITTQFEAEYDTKKVVRFDFPELLTVLENLETDNVVMKIGEGKTVVINDMFILLCKGVKDYSTQQT